MSKGHFELLAETISNTPKEEGGLAPMVPLYDLIEELASMCASTNPAFDRIRFINACRSKNYRAPKGVTRY